MISPPDKALPWQPLLDFLHRKGAVFSVSGLKGSAPAYLLSRIAPPVRAPILFLAPDETRAEQRAEEIHFFLDPLRKVLLYPSWDVNPFQNISPSPEVMGQRWEARHALSRPGADFCLVSSLAAVLEKVPPREASRRFALDLAPGREFQREDFISRLQGLGYTRVHAVAQKGEFAVRGFLLDVFSPASAQPLRIEFFGDRVEAVRNFDPDTQRSLRDLPDAAILPVREVLLFPEFQENAAARLKKRMEEEGAPREAIGEVLEKIREGIAFGGIDNYLPLFYPALESLLDYLPPHTLVVLEDPPEIEDRLSRIGSEARETWREQAAQGEFWPAPEELLLTRDDFAAFTGLFSRVLLQGVEMGESPPGKAGIRLESESNERLRSELLSSKSEEGVLHLLAQRIRSGAEKGISALLPCSSLRSAERLQEMLENHGLRPNLIRKPFSAWTPADSSGWQGTLLLGNLHRGFSFPGAGLAVIPESELFGEKRPRKRPAVPLKDRALAAFSELQLGDYVVHADHGIGIYRGLLKLALGEEEHDFLLIEYQGGDKLYLPVYRLNLVQKYAGGGESGPRVDRLGGTSWETAKRKVRKSLRELAEELVKLYAERTVLQGHAFPPPDEIYREFEASFAYEETPDQLQAITDVQKDMGAEKSMDRLVCGDVGFGKTEVALRAAFRAMMAGKQVAVLVPTTVLAQQHYQTFSARFSSYPFRIEMLSRFRSPAEQKNVIREIAGGKVDLVVGTHRLLQKDLVFKDLGLLVVDEEHRFGVAHKEKLKRLRANVDALTLTATPIPRTLQMSLTGIRDLSVIESPPEERQPIRTFVIEFDEEIVRDAIRRELRRGGQVFFVHNRVQSIEAMGRFLRRLVPEARIGIAHGQMAERNLERVMLSFVKREIDLLLTTTIIESGLDFPSANTILINRADKLGLAQMYQLRGRVGRSSQRAYAYLLVPGLAALTSDARKRLEALQEVTELGSGMKLALHDLEIRGAGALLGDAQSGHVAAVGYDMYLQILEEAVQEMKGEEVVPEVEPEMDLPLPALIPGDYMDDIHQRLVFYRRLASARSAEDLEECREELRDRYGPFPASLENLFLLMDLKLLLKKAQVRRISWEKEKVVILFDAQAPVDPKRLVSAVARGKGSREFTPDQRLKLRPAAKDWPGRISETKKILLEILGDGSIVV
jgi:transcription-repair coupling factor (superfamily II helicase)